MIELVEANMAYLIIGISVLHILLWIEMRTIIRWAKADDIALTQIRNDMGERFRDIERRHEELNSFIATNAHVKREDL